MNEASPPDWLVQEAILAPVAAQLLTPGTELRVREDWIQVIRDHAPHPSMNEVVFSRLFEAEADEVIDDTIARYASIPTSFKWSVPQGSGPDDLGDRLRARGLHGWIARAMSCRTDSATEGPDATDVSDDPDAYAVTSAAGWDIAGGALDEYGEGLRWAAQTGRFGLFLADDGAGAAAVVRSGRVGLLMGAVVLPEHRGRGHYASLLRTRLRWLADRGVDHAVTLAREATSAPILQAQGFDTLFRYEVFQWDPPAG